MPPPRGGPSDFDRVQAWGLAHLRELVKTYGRVEPNKAGRCPCPIHGGDGLNFSVTDGQGWTCHSKCNASGDGVEFVRLMRFNALGKKEGRIAALRELAPQAGVALHEKGERRPQAPFRPKLAPPIAPPRVEPAPKPTPLDALRDAGIVPHDRGAVYAELLELATLTEQGQTYMASRGLRPDLMQIYGFRSVDSYAQLDQLVIALRDTFLPEELANAGLWDLARDRPAYTILPRRADWGAGSALVIPYHADTDDGGMAPAAIRFRALAKDATQRYQSIPGMDIPVPFNWEAVSLAVGGDLHITEGELNAITLALHGINAIGLPGAGAWRPEWSKPIKRVGRLVAWFDNDPAGTKGVAKLAKTLQAELGRSWLESHSAPPQLVTDDINALHQRGTLYDRLRALA